MRTVKALIRLGHFVGFVMSRLRYVIFSEVKGIQTNQPCLASAMTQRTTA